MAIDLTGKDPFGTLTGGSGTDPIANFIANPSIASGNPYLMAADLAIKLLSGSDTSEAAGGANSILNTSGQVIGEGDAIGGALDSNKNGIGFAWPWWYWVAGSLVAIAIIKKVQ